MTKITENRISRECDELKDALMELECSCNPTATRAALKRVEKAAAKIQNRYAGWVRFLHGISA